MRKLLLLIILLPAVVSLSAAGLSKIQLSYNYEAKKDYKNAIEVMKQLEKSDPDDSFYIIRLGWLFYLNADYNKAFDYYQKSDSDNPSLEAKEGMLNSLLASKKYNECILYGSQFLKEYPRNTVFIAKIGYAYYARKDYSNAVKYYKEYCSYKKWDFDGQAYLLRACYLSGDLNSARQVYNFFLKYLPSSTIINEFSDKLK